MAAAIKLYEHLSYKQIDDNQVADIIAIVRDGIRYTQFQKVAIKIPFTLQEWADYLQMSLRSLQRTKKQKARFNSVQSERIVQIVMLYKFGVRVFGKEENFNTWLDLSNVALGGVKPKSLLDNTFGINVVKSVLGRIEHGIYS